MSRIICIDFDGVIHEYTSGWQGAGAVADGVVPGAIEAIIAYIEAGFAVAVFSSRSKETEGLAAMRSAIYGWLLEHFKPEDELHFSADTHKKASKVYSRIDFPTTKPPAVLTIDDRAWCFTGNFPTPDEVKAFVPWNKKPTASVKEALQSAGFEALDEVLDGKEAEKG